jgi:hypothetical protein
MSAGFSPLGRLSSATEAGSPNFVGTALPEQLAEKFKNVCIAVEERLFRAA